MNDLSLMVDDVKFNYRVGLLIKKKDMVLVEVNPHFDFVVLPGGRVKTLESSIKALKREIKEEMDINLDEYNISVHSIIENFFEMKKKYHELYFLYEVSIEEDDANFIDGLKNIDSESCYYKWVNINELDKVNLLPKCLINNINSKEFNLMINDDINK